MSTMTIVAALDLALALSTRGLQIANMIRAGMAEGRNELTPSEWADVIAARDKADEALERAALIAEAEGR